MSGEICNKQSLEASANCTQREGLLAVRRLRCYSLPTMRARTPRAFWSLACALLAACSRSAVGTSHEPGATETADRALNTSSCRSSAEIAVLHHEAALTVALSPPTLTGQGEVHFQALTTARSVALDTPGLRVVSASAQGQPVKLTAAADTTCFELPQPLAAGEELTLSMSWQLDPQATGVTFTTDQAWAGFPSRAWLPTKIDRVQQATLSLSMMAPDDLVLVTSFTKRGIEKRPSNELHVSSYELTTPSSPFRYAFVVGRFAKSVFSGPGFSLSAYGPRDVDLLGVLERTLPMYQFLRERTGSAAGTRNYTQVFVHGEAAQDALGLAFLSEHVARDLDVVPDSNSILGRRLAHQWFGVFVPCADAEDLWLHEGLATFMVGAFREQEGGAAAYERELTSWAIAHERGALVLDRLRAELGEKAFWRGIRLYVSNQAGKPSRADDLKNALTAASGRDLTSFFDSWVYSPEPDL